MEDQRIGPGMQPCGFIDGESEGFGDRQTIVILGRRVPFRIQQFRRRRFQPARVFGERHIEPLAIGRRLLVRERQAAERLREHLRSGALVLAAGAGDEIVGADFLRPEADFDWRGDSAPGVGVRRDQHARRPARRQIGFEARRVDRVVIDQQQPVALVPQPLAHFVERWFLFLVDSDPAKPHPKRNEIGAHGRFGLRQDPPGRAIIGAMAFGVGRRDRRLADAAQPMQRGDRDPALVTFQRHRSPRARRRGRGNEAGRRSGCSRARRGGREMRLSPGAQAALGRT